MCWMLAKYATPSSETAMLLPVREEKNRGQGLTNIKNSHTSKDRTLERRGATS